jgi:cytochrome b561
MALHWVIAILLIPMLFFGEDLMDAEGGETLLPSIHVSVGITILVLSLIRLGWRLANPPPPAPPGTAAWENWAAGLTHGLFYVLMIGLPVSGWLAFARVSTEEPEFAGTRLFGFNVPLAPNVGFPIEDTHGFASNVGIALLILHVAAALKHHFVNRDSVLTSMLPGRR